MKLINLVIFVLLISILSGSVFAGLSIPSDLAIGGSDVDKYDSSGNNNIVTKTFTLTATEFTYGGLTYEFAPQNSFPSSNINIMNIPSSISTSGGGVSLTVNITIPDDFSAVNEDLEETSFDIGTIKIKSSNYTDSNGTNVVQNTMSGEMQLTLQVENSLSLPSLKLNMGSSETSVSKGSTITVHAGDDIELVFTVKNKFNSNSGIDFNTVNIKVNSDDLSIDEDSDINNIGPDEEKTKNINFELDDETTGTFDVDVDIKGTDEDGGLHGFEYDFKLKVEASTISNTEGESGEEQVPDSDHDGVNDLEDFCPNTFLQCVVDSRGCETDTDGDGICNSLDSTPGTEQIIQQSVNTQQQPNNNDEEKQETTKEKKDSTNVGSDGFIPFVVGFITGLILTAAFFILIRS